jgi:hypothetical protein
MKKLIASSSILIICILLIPMASPLVYSQNISTQKTISIQTNINSETSSQKQTTYVSSSDVEELRQLLILLDDALTRKDSKEIHYCETILKSKGILPATYQFETTKPALESRYQKLGQHLLPLLGDDNISNSLCYVHATGTGMIFFTVGLLLIIPTLILMGMFGVGILNVLLPLYLLIMFITHLIPFRVLLPVGALIIDNGNVSAVGVSGSQHITVNTSSVQINLVGFTGITINIPSSNSTQGFLFVSGFSFFANSRGSSQNQTAGILQRTLWALFTKNSL